MRSISGALGSGRFLLGLSAFGEWGGQFSLLLIVATSASSGLAL